ncbi:MAG: hypothetical protein ABIF19_15820 [Planctomycetota bacterium]
MDEEPWELYDMETDPVELRNLALEYPERTAQLEALWTKWYQSSPARQPADRLLP